MRQSFEILEDIHTSAIDLINIKTFLRITYDHDDEFLQTLLKRAVNFAENFLRYSLTSKKISYTATNIQHNYKRLELPVAYAKEIIQVKRYEDGEEIDLEKQNYELTQDKSHLWILVPNKITKLHIIYKTEEILLTNPAIQTSILTHISNMYDNKDNSDNYTNYYLPYRKILI